MNLHDLIGEAELTIDKLHDLRQESIKLTAQRQRLHQKFSLDQVEIKRLEAKMILEQSNATQSNGQPLVRDDEVRRAVVEDLLSRNPRFIKVMNWIKNHTRAETRITAKLETVKAHIAFHESKEKLFLVKAKA